MTLLKDPAMPPDWERWAAQLKRCEPGGLCYPRGAAKALATRLGLGVRTVYTMTPAFRLHCHEFPGKCWCGCKGGRAL